MAVPPEDMLLGPAPTPGRTPGSAPGAQADGAAAPLPGLSDMRITPASLPGLPSGDGADLLPDIGGGASGATSAGGFDLGADLEPLPMEGLDEEQLQAEEASAAQQRQRRVAQPRRRRPTVDAHADGRAATTLPSEHIRALLADRKPLLVARGLRARGQAAALPPRGFDVAAQSEAARDSELFRPAAFAALAPELLQLFGRAMQLPGEGGPAAQRRRRSSRGGAADEEEAAAAAAELAAEQAAAGLEPEAPFSTGGYSDAAPFSAGGWADDYPEQEPTQELGAGAFPPGPEEGEAAAQGGEAGAAAERRARLQLQPVSSNGELGSIGACTAARLPDADVGEGGSPACTSGASGLPLSRPP